MKNALSLLILAATFAIAPSAVFPQGEAPPPKEDEGADKAEKAKTYADQGQQFYAKFKETGDANQLGLARQCFMRALEFDKASFDSMLGLGEVFLFEANLGGAGKYLLDAVKLKPKHQRANYLLGSVHLKLEKYDKAIVALKAAYESEEGLVQDPETQVMLPYEYGKCLARMGKGEDAAKVLRPLAEGGKFEMFGTYKATDARRAMYWEGYQMVGEAYMGMGQYQEADNFLSKAVANCKQLLEGKVTPDLDGAYVYNKFRVPVPSQGQADGDRFLHTASKLLIVKPKGWDFCFPHLECYHGDENRYKQNSQAACISIWLIEKNKERQYGAKVDVTIEAWDVSVNLTMGGVAVALSNAKNVCEVQLEGYKKQFDVVMNDRKNPFTPITKAKMNSLSGAYFKGLFQHKENEKIRQDREFWCFISATHSFFFSIEGDEGIFKTYAKELDLIKRSITIQK